ncbi:MAG: glycosyltransferase family 4 protein [Thermoplasmata archaeon]
MRVLIAGTGVHAIPPRGYGGVERTLAELARALRAEGAEVLVVNMVRHERSIDEYLFAAGLPRRIRQAPDAVVHASTPAVANRLSFAGIPYVYTTHSRHWFLKHGARERFGFWLERRAVARSAAAIALTESVHRTVLRVVGGRVPTRFPVIPIGVDLEQFPASPIPRGDRLLGVGVVARIKRWELAAEAAGRTGTEFVLIGPLADPAYAEELRAIGPHVTLRGEVSESELARAYADCDLLLHPSAVELLPGVVLQALASGRPVLGADPLVGVVRPGATGFLSPPGADGAEIVSFLSARIEELRADRARADRMGEEARRDAAGRFSWPTVARAHLALYGAVHREAPHRAPPE